MLIQQPGPKAPCLGPLGSWGPCVSTRSRKKTDQAMRVTSWFIHMWVFINGGIPNSWMVYFMENPKIKKETPKYHNIELLDDLWMVT